MFLLYLYCTTTVASAAAVLTLWLLVFSCTVVELIELFIVKVTAICENYRSI